MAQSAFVPARWLAVTVAFLCLTPPALRAAALTPEAQKAVRASTFEVVMKKPEPDPLSYEKPLPLELLPYIERTDLYRSMGTAFALGHNTYVTAAHVILAGVGSQFGPPALRRADGTVFEIARILEFSAYQDFVVFSLRDDPVPPGLAVNREPQIDDPVIAVGNALGEGIVMRDGLYTSATPEEQDARWKWIRFSAAASPGNSGGPLLDAQGRVIGIVIGKSPNENLNYSLPIAQVLDAPEHKARFDQRQLISLPYLHGTQTYAFQDSFDLPLSWPEFAHSYLATIERHEEISLGRLLKNYADSEFPRGDGTESVLYAADANDFQLRLIMQEADGRWAGSSPDYTTTDLPGDGSVSVANEGGAVLIRVVRPNNAADGAFYSDSRAFMDLALKAMNLRRTVGSDEVRITSLGKAMADTVFVDPYGRKWQERTWAVPFLDILVTALLLPTPDGYSGIIHYQPSGMHATLEKRLRLLAGHADVSYTGTLAQWQAFLARRALLPGALEDVKLEAAPKWKLATKRFSSSVLPDVMALNSNSVLSLTMGFSPVETQVAWGIEEVWWYRDAQLKAAVGLARTVQPPGTAKLSLRSRFDDMRSRRAPYNAQSSREGKTTYSAATVLDVPMSRPGLVAADLLYSLTLRSDEASDFGKLPKLLQQVAATTQILERGSGEGAVPAQAGLSTPKDPLDGYEEKFREFAEKTDKAYGTDSRGRKASEDLRDLLAEFKTRFDASGADREQLSAELQARVQTLEKYWITVLAVRSNRDVWPDFLARNGLPADTPHTAGVIAAEQALMTALRSGLPSEEWATLGDRLRDAYIEERHANNHWKPVSEADYHPRLSPCPAPATATSGSQQAKTLTMSRTPADFYPEVSRKAFLEGSVILSLRISVTGCAERLAIGGSSGSELLDDAAMRFGETIEFLPAERDGKAVASTKELRVTFKETT